MDKKTIKRYLIGELCIPLSFNDSVYISKEEEDIIDNGGILIDDSVLDNNNLYYKHFLTVFYQNTNKKFFCLHNNKEYSIRKNIRLKNLLTMEEVLPKIDYSFKGQMSFDEAIYLFNKLFHRFHYFDYDNMYFDLKRFYVGDLNLCTNIKKNSLVSERNIPLNTVQSYLTFFGNGQFIGGYSIDYKSYIYYYEVFRCLFFEAGNNKAYNLNNYQFYQNSALNYSSNDSFYPGESFCDSFVPLSEEVSLKGADYNSSRISFNKALRLQRKIKNFDIHSL